MTETTDADAGVSTGLKVLVWIFRALQIGMVGLGGILFLGSLPMRVGAAAFVWPVVGLVWLLAVVVEFVAVRPIKGAA